MGIGDTLIKTESKLIQELESLLKEIAIQLRIASMLKRKDLYKYRYAAIKHLFGSKEE